MGARRTPQQGRKGSRKSGGQDMTGLGCEMSSVISGGSTQMRLHLEGDMPKVKKGHSKTRQPSKKACRKSLGSLEDVEEGNDQSRGSSSSKELVIYNPSNTSEDVVAITDHMGNHASGFSSLSTADPYSRVLPSVGAFTVQCAACFKWRFIPTKEKYEEIRERILEEPFICDRAREWRADISCDDPTDISQDGSRLWAIDKPNIAQPPPGWQRLLRIRGEGSTKFADIYYVSPSGKRLRSMVEIQKYLLQHPEYIRQGVNLSQFSFLTPKPLQESYVRKRAGLVTNSCNDDDLRLPRPLEPDEVNPLLWAGRAMSEELQMDAAGMPAPHFESPSYHSSMDVPLLPPPAKRKAPNKLSSKQCSPVYDQPQTRKEDTHQL